MLWQISGAEKAEAKLTAIAKLPAKWHMEDAREYMEPMNVCADQLEALVKGKVAFAMGRKMDDELITAALGGDWSDES